MTLAMADMIRTQDLWSDEKILNFFSHKYAINLCCTLHSTGYLASTVVVVQMAKVHFSVRYENYSRIALGLGLGLYLYNIFRDSYKVKKKV